jgi:hypothetical protein
MSIWKRTAVAMGWKLLDKFSFSMALLLLSASATMDASDRPKLLPVKKYLISFEKAIIWETNKTNLLD